MLTLQCWQAEGSRNRIGLATVLPLRRSVVLLGGVQNLFSMGSGIGPGIG
jgi:hypothetical protein